MSSALAAAVALTCSAALCILKYQLQALNQVTVMVAISARRSIRRIVIHRRFIAVVMGTALG